MVMKISLQTPSNPPKAKRIESLCSVHGVQWVDHYAWLRADNWQEVMEDPTQLPAPIASYLNAENEYYDKAMVNLAPLRQELAAEIRGRMSDKLESIPTTDGPYRYRYCFVENAEHPIRVRTDLNGDFEEVIFDVNAAAGECEHFDLGQLTHSPNHKKLLWSCDTSGAEFFTLYIRDIATGLDSDVIENVDTATWGDDQTVFYTRLNSACRATQVYKHMLGSDPERDVLVFTELDERFYCSVGRSIAPDFVFIDTSSDDQDEVWFIPVSDLGAAPRLVQERTEGLEYSVVSGQGDRFIIKTNREGATDRRLVETPVNATSFEHWTDLVPYQAGRMIEDVIVFQDWIIWLEVVNALPQIAYRDKHGFVKRIQFDEQAYSLSIYGQLDYQAQSLIFEYSSPTTPTETYEFDLSTAERVVLKRQCIPSGHNPSDYIARRISFESHDGALVPVTLLYRHDTAIDGTAPMLLCGYGANGLSVSARFGSARLSLVDRGFVYAIAHVRGGEDKGCAWYEDAKLERKTNSFLDFIAVAEALVAQGYCAADKLVSYGGSSGGLLVAASMNMRPELFAGVIAEMPFVDVLGRLLDDTLPGAPVKWLQWGNPIESRAAFDSIRRYSPCENIKAVAYPALYVTAGVSDPRVSYWEPAKWVANIRALKTDNNIVLFRINMQSGHFGQAGRFGKIDDTAAKYAFAISVTSDLQGESIA